MQRYIGIMSGTSMDGIDTVLVETDGQQIALIHSDAYPMPTEIKQQLLNMCTGQATTLFAVGELDNRLGNLFADAVLHLLQKYSIDANSITAIGSHGQTVFHSPDSQYPFSMQIGDANLIAARTQITTVADFRRKDMAYGGQGAPLAPAFHRTLFGQQDSSCVVLNIGGMANISVLRRDHPVLGYDTGPGNVLMDLWISKHQNCSYDKDALWAKSGNTNQSLLQHLLQEPYLQRTAPKSTGRELFNIDWLEKRVQSCSVSARDIQATLLEFTAVTIANEARLYAQGENPRLLLCGGGARNPLLFQRLSELLQQWIVESTHELGIDSDYMEAMAFAWLAHQAIHKLPSNVPEVTGATQAVSLGVIYNV
ncbi:MAG: anhydro-N-acetylmuramic acid kinase [Aliivibrio sp.]|uniref:anhydro-N-acetylmuramic acid kinase n=1 Tax=Aliivibrio sp. TaxID=1872443 RepID=UPI001A37570F|nr:anhydro-N-acetylmuramic acid kinase [Aliivibrio sp.]